MADHVAADATPTGVPATPPDPENPALIDLEKTFRITVISAVLFALAALLIIISTRIG